MYKILYAVWILIPVFFFTLALWSKLEQASGKPKRDRPDDLVKQGFFISICVVVSIFLDQYALPPLYEMISVSFIPLGFFQVLLLPFVFVVLAQVIGPTKDIKITKAPRPTENKKKSKNKK